MVKAAVVHKSSAITMLQISQSTGNIVTASSDKTVKCFDLRGGEGRNLSRVKILQNSAPIKCGKLLDHGNLCMLGGSDGHLSAYDLAQEGKSGTSLYNYSARQTVGAINCMAVAPEFHNNAIVLGGETGQALKLNFGDF